MARDPLRILLSLRRRSVEQARQALAVRLTSVSEVEGMIHALDEATRRDREAGNAWLEATQFLEVSANRRRALQAERRTLTTDLAAAEVDAAAARDVVATARSEAEVVQTLDQERTAARQADAARRGQHVLDDIARTRFLLRQRR